MKQDECVATGAQQAMQALGKAEAVQELGPNDIIVAHRCGHRRVFTIPAEMTLEQAVLLKLQPCSWCEELAAETDEEALGRLPANAAIHKLYWTFREEGMAVRQALQEVVSQAVQRCAHCRLDFFPGEHKCSCAQCGEMVCERCFADPSHVPCTQGW